jgi:hypothetical protein
MQTVHQLRSASLPTFTRSKRFKSFNNSVVRAASTSSPEYQCLEGLKVVSAASGVELELLSLWQPSPSNVVVIPFLTHFADLSSWEYGQKLVQKVIPRMEEQGIQVCSVRRCQINSLK